MSPGRIDQGAELHARIASRDGNSQASDSGQEHMRSKVWLCSVRGVVDPSSNDQLDRRRNIAQDQSICGTRGGNQESLQVLSDARVLGVPRVQVGCQSASVLAHGLGCPTGVKPLAGSVDADLQGARSRWVAA